MLKGFGFGRARLGVVAAAVVGLASAVWADGTETLGTPGIAIAPGTDVIAAGTGLETQPGTISLNVPAGVSIEQVLLYWSGEFRSVSDDTIMVDGVEITGTSIGGPTVFFNFNGPVSLETFRADITALGLVGPGANSLSVSGLAYDFSNSGAGIAVIVDDGGPGSVEVRDGQDLAFFAFAPPLDTTVPQTFLFAASGADRSATLDVFAGSVGGADRPNKIVVTTGGVVTEFVNPLGSFDGPFWDTVELPVTVPAGADSLTVQALSESDGSSDLPASFNWITATATVPAPPALECRMTGGGVDRTGVFDPTQEAQGCKENDCYTMGGQAGAPTASQPQPFGEWTHHQRRGPSGQFVFHMGTSSAPPGTEIDLIECSDPGNCLPARPAPNKQLDFHGVGTFNSIHNNVPDEIKDAVVVGESLHCAWVHIEDLGEPGQGGRIDPPADTCPPEGSAGAVADCDCPDFYRIEIHETADCSSDTIYEVFGYIRGGNLQIHPPIQ